MKNHGRLALLCLLTPVIAAAADTAAPANANPGHTAPVRVITARQIQVKARFIERTGKDGAEDVISAPTVVTSDGQLATIEVGQEIPVPPADPAAAPQSVKVGIRLEVTPRLLGGRRILLQGLAEVRERVKSESGAAEIPGQLVFSTRSVSFNLDTLSGASTVLGGLEQEGRTFSIELTARELPADNAAPRYWQAFAALPDKPDAKEGPEFEQWLADAEPALILLRGAAAKRDCDWELDYSKGPELALPHLSKARSLGTAALARARRALSINGDAAAADIAAVLHLCRHVGTDALLISQLVRVGLEKQALETALAPEAAWTPAQAALLLAVVEAARPCPDLADCLEMERTTFIGWLRSELKRAGVKRFGETVSALGASADEKSMAFWKGRGERELFQLLDAADADYQEAIRIACLPAAERGPAHEAWQAKLRQDKERHLLSLLIMPTVDMARGKLAEADARMEKARAALKERAGGGVN